MLQADDETFLKDIMIDNVIALDEDNNLKKLPQCLRDMDLGNPIPNESDRIIGAVTFRDMNET